MNIENIGSDEARRDAVHSTEINPFHRQTLGHLHDTRLGRIILAPPVSALLELNQNKMITHRRLLLRHVHQRRAHGRCENHVPKSLLLEDPRACLRRVERPVQVHFHDIAPLVGRIILRGHICADARVGDDDVQPAEVGCDLLDGLFDLLLFADVGLVGYGSDVVLACDVAG